MVVEFCAWDSPWVSHRSANSYKVMFTLGGWAAFSIPAAQPAPTPAAPDTAYAGASGARGAARGAGGRGGAGRGRGRGAGVPALPPNSGSASTTNARS